MPDLTIRVAASDDEVAAAGALAAEAYHADHIIDDGDEYLDELADAARRAREATLLVALVPTAQVGTDGWADEEVEEPVPADVLAHAGAHAAPPRSAVRWRRRRRASLADETVVGTVTLAPAGTSYAEVANAGEVEVRMLAVAPEARRRGVAEALMRAAMLEAVSLGAVRLVLSTVDGMSAAHRLYGRLGFTPARERDWGHEGVSLRVFTWELPDGPGAEVEAATWPPTTVEDVDGWRVGLSGGFTRRANSVLALEEPADVEAAVRQVERLYAAHHQPAIFRVCDRSRPRDLAEVLEHRGYRDVSHTLVLVRDLSGEQLPGTPRIEPAAGGTAESDGATTAGDDATPFEVVTQDAPDDTWLDVWLSVKDAHHPVDRDLARRILGGAPALYLTGSDDQGVVGVIRAALVDDWVGLAALAVVPRARRRGVGRALTVVALRAAERRGATRAFLQVEERNESAVALYEGLGFVPAERYRYFQR